MTQAGAHPGREVSEPAPAGGDASPLVVGRGGAEVGTCEMREKVKKKRVFMSEKRCKRPERVQ